MEEPGTYLNLEVEFVYKRSIGNDITGKEEESEGEVKKDNMHFVVYLGVGVVSTSLSSFHIYLPDEYANTIWCEIEEISQIRITSLV